MDFVDIHFEIAEIFREARLRPGKQVGQWNTTVELAARQLRIQLVFALLGAAQGKHGIPFLEGNAVVVNQADAISSEHHIGRQLESIFVALPVQPALS